ncbi:6497_t:CDS:1, partial [Cetraspora pellucida]
LVEDLEFFQIRKKPVAPFVTQCLTHLEVLLQSGIIEPPISKEIKHKFEDNHFKIDAYITIFHEVYQLAFNKLKKHIDQHLALSLFKAIQCFDL